MLIYDIHQSTLIFLRIIIITQWLCSPYIHFLFRLPFSCNCNDMGLSLNNQVTNAKPVISPALSCAKMTVDKLTVTFLVDNCIEWFYWFSLSYCKSLECCF